MELAETTVPVARADTVVAVALTWSAATWLARKVENRLKPPAMTRMTTTTRTTILIMLLLFFGAGGTGIGAAKGAIPGYDGADGGPAYGV